MKPKQLLINHKYLLSNSNLRLIIQYSGCSRYSFNHSGKIMVVYDFVITDNLINKKDSDIGCQLTIDVQDIENNVYFTHESAIINTIEDLYAYN